MDFLKLNRSTVIPFLVFVALSVPAILVQLNGVVHPSDDAFITFRYVENFLDGHGLVYNLKERVFGSTTPLYTAWLIVLKFLFAGVSIDVLSVRLNVVPFVVASAAIYVLTLKLTRSRVVGLACAGYFQLSPLMLEISISGMESIFFLALFLWSLVATVSGRLSAGAVLAGCAVLTRPEGVFALIPIAAMLNWREPRSWLRPGLAFLGPVPLWVVPAYLYYGTPVPHSLIAKAAPLYELPAGTSTSVLFGQFESFLFFDWLKPFDSGARLTGWVLLLAAMCLSVAGRCRRFDVLGVAGACAAVLGFYVWSNPLMMHWYWSLVKVSFVLFLVLGFGCGAVLLSQCFPRHSKSVLRGGVLLFCCWVCGVTSLEWQQHFSRAATYDLDLLSMTRDKNSEVNRIHAYREAAEWLNVHRSDSLPLVAAPEIGALGYYYRGPILDTCGLVSPTAVPYHPVAKTFRGDILGAIPPGLMRDAVPPIVVTAPGFAMHGAFKDPWFLRHYRIRHKIPLRAGLYARSNQILILEYEKSPSALSPVDNGVVDDDR